MTAWRPASGPDAAASRAAILRRLRAWFLEQGVLEVDTPVLGPAAVSDTRIESFEIGSSRVSARPLFLHTSPEFHMKRLLAAGYPDIYSICRVFRDGESGRSHQPEFTLLEWYRLGMDLADIVEDALCVASAALGARAPQQDPVTVDYRRAFAETCGVDIDTSTPAILADAAGADANLRKAIGNEINDWLDLLLATAIVPTFPADRITVLRHYPADQAALARLCPRDATVADRFELFLGPVEIANGYVELTNASERAARIARDNELRQRRGLPVRPVDTQLLNALEEGLPECAGVAMGLERLQMVYDKVEDIRKVITFGFDDNA